MKFHFLKRAIVIVLAALLPGCQPSPPNDQNAADIEAVLVLYENYRAAWLRNDSQTEAEVLALFTEDAIIIPSGGAMIFTGKAEMKEFWFPENAPPAPISIFEVDTERVMVGPKRAELIARFTLQFSFEGESYYTEGYHHLAAVFEDQAWKISSMMWTHPPWEKQE